MNTALNIAIARERGWQWLRHPNGRNDLIKPESISIFESNGWVKIGEPKPDEFCDDSTVPNYTGSNDAAMELLRSLRAEGWRVVIMDWDAATSDTGEPGWQVTIFRAKQGIMNGEQYEAVEFSFALAITTAYAHVRNIPVE